MSERIDIKRVNNFGGFDDLKTVPFIDNHERASSPQISINISPAQNARNEALQKAREQYDILVDSKYNGVVEPKIQEMMRSSNHDGVRLLRLYEWLTDDEHEYDFGYSLPNSNLTGHDGYIFYVDGQPNEEFRITQDTKYPAILAKKGVCKTYAEAFTDIAKKMGIPCVTTTGLATMGHAWNAVLINDEVRYIDVSSALMHRQENPNSFFMKNQNEITQAVHIRQWNQNESEIRDLLETQKPKMKIISK